MRGSGRSNVLGYMYSVSEELKEYVRSQGKVAQIVLEKEESSEQGELASESGEQQKNE